MRLPCGGSGKLCFRLVQDACCTLFLWNVIGGDSLMILKSPSSMSFPLIAGTLSMCNVTVLWKAGST